MASNLPSGTVLKVKNPNTDEVENFTVEARVNKGRGLSVYAGGFESADDEAPATLVIDNEDGTGMLAW